MKSERSRSSETAAWTGIAGDLILALLKGSAGYIFNSKALMGDGLYAASDAATSLARVLTTGKLKERGQDRLHYGNPKVRQAVPILFSVLLLMTGLELASAAIRSLGADEPSVPGMYALVTAFAGLALKEAFFQFQYRFAKKKGEAEINAHINGHRFSLYSSLAALLGMIGAMAGQAFGVEFLLYLDPVASLLIACLVLRKGYVLIVQPVYGSLGEELREEDVRQYKETIQRVRGIVTIESLKALELGDTVAIDAVISVSPRITVQEAQEIADRAKTLLMTRFARVTDVKIQFSPYQSVYPYKTNHELPENDVSPLIQ
ncbi:cation diffusion facilitator family transporter [Paenibacillus sp. P96]|uniref:Cation diffusion facilitator family transporter n=1 Tax=Paenibacillus zeirhizosphaerae TaxID=2987519 RepID=A0ABT9FKI8_9BACL|nr:cation diffusion facilitator family transporter [Paenibacillus sp. P96]MDP4095199.1 cation diffusion facilitator family transporter [Paenibacillus sp. P96]